MSVAHCYSHGKGVDVDFHKAFEYHKLAAEKGMCLVIKTSGVQYISIFLIH